MAVGVPAHHPQQSSSEMHLPPSVQSMVSLLPRQNKARAEEPISVQRSSGTPWDLHSKAFKLFESKLLHVSPGPQVFLPSMALGLYRPLQTKLVGEAL